MSLRRIASDGVCKRMPNKMLNPHALLHGRQTSREQAQEAQTDGCVQKAVNIGNDQNNWAMKVVCHRWKKDEQIRERNKENSFFGKWSFSAKQTLEKSTTIPTREHPALSLAFQLKPIKAEPDRDNTSGWATNRERIFTELQVEG